MARKRNQPRGSRSGRFPVEWRQSGVWIVFIVTVADFLLDPAKIWKKPPPKLEIDRAATRRPKPAAPETKKLRLGSDAPVKMRATSTAQIARTTCLVAPWK